MGVLLQFPERDRGRKRRRNSPAAMGDMSLLANRGTPAPANVARMATVRGQAAFDHAELALMASLAVFAVLSDDQKTSLREQLILLDLGHGDWRATSILDMIGRA